MSNPIELDFSCSDISIVGSQSNETYNYTINDAAEGGSSSNSLPIEESFKTLIEPSATANVNIYNTNQVHYPDLYIACMQTRNNIKVTSEAMLDFNWMTEELIEEIETYYPQTEHFIMDQFKNSCKRHISPFPHHFPKMFPKDHTFASSKQFEQAAVYFGIG